MKFDKNYQNFGVSKVKVQSCSNDPVSTVPEIQILEFLNLDYSEIFTTFYFREYHAEH